MVKRTKRATSLALSRAVQTALVGNLATLDYGGSSTPGPRQTSILAQIASCKATRSGWRAATVAEVAETQGIARGNAEMALACLRRRGLVVQRGSRFGLTRRGAEAAAAIAAVQVPAGIGLVLTGHVIRRA